MSWADGILNDSETRNQYVRVTSRIKVSDSLFTNYSGNIYSTPFSYGPVHTFEVDGTAYTLATSIAGVTASKFYYDRDAKMLYIYSSPAPADAHFYCAHFYLFFSNNETLWFEDPSDDASATIFWPGLLKEAPSFKITIPPLGLGLFPIDPSNLVVANDGTLNYVLGNGSFNRTSVEVWESFGAQDVDNVSKRLSAVVGQRVNVTDSSISFDVVDKGYDFDSNISGAYFTSTVTDPKFQNCPAMKIWGFGAQAVYEMVNLDYNSEAPTTSNNRKFGLVYDTGSDYAEVSAAGTMNSGAFRLDLTNPDDGELFRPGQKVWWDTATVDQYLTIDSVDSTGGGSSNGRVTFTTNPAGALSGNLKSCFAQNCFIVKGDGTSFQLLHGRDFTEAVHESHFRGITLRSTAEANAGCATFDPNTDTLWCMPDGKRVYPQNGAIDLTENPSVNGDFQFTKGFRQGLNVLYDFLKSECGFSESEINFSSFSTANNIAFWSAFLPCPLTNNSEYPTKRDILDLILSSMMLRAYFDENGRFTVMAYKYVDTISGTIEKEEHKSYSFDLEYSDITKIQFGYAWETDTIRRLAYSGTKAQILAGTAAVKLVESPIVNRVTDATGSDSANYLHKSDKTTVISHIVSEDDFQTYFFSRMYDLYGERSGLMRIEGKKIALDREPSEDVSVFRDSMVGQNDAEGSSSNFEILEIEKGFQSVNLTLNDKKAANDNSAESYWQFAEDL